MQAISIQNDKKYLRSDKESSDIIREPAFILIKYAIQRAVDSYLYISMRIVKYNLNQKINSPPGFLF